MPDSSHAASVDFCPARIFAANRRDGIALTTRSLFSIAAALWTAALLYGSLIPFDFAQQDVSARLAEMVASTPWETGSGFDWTINILAATPLGFLWSAARNASRLGQSAVIAAGCGLFALAIEVLQIWLPLRVPSIRDVLALTTGAMLGCGLWHFSRRLVLSQLPAPVLKRFSAESNASSSLIRGIGVCGISMLSGLIFTFGIEPVRWFEMYRRRELHPSAAGRAFERIDFGSPAWLAVILVVMLTTCVALLSKWRLSLRQPNLRVLLSPAGQTQPQSGTIAKRPSESGPSAKTLRRAA